MTAAVVSFAIRETLVDVEAEWDRAVAAATRQDFDALEAAGVPNDFMWSGPARFGVASVELQDGTYQPAEDGRRVYLAPAMPMISIWDADCLDREIIDLVAWLPENPRQWWQRIGAPILNPDAIEEARHFERPLWVRSDPLAWLKARGDGIIILDMTADLRFWLGGVPVIHADTLRLGQQIDWKIREPRQHVPSVLVPAAMG